MYGNIWWAQVGRSLRFLSRVADALREGRSTLVQLPENLPWPNLFRDAVELRCCGASAARRLIREGWTPGADPGRFVLETFCDRDVVCEYWPGEPPGAYLGRREDIGLCEYDIWITGIRRKEDLMKWQRFLTDYQTHSRELPQRAVFLLEYSGPVPEGWNLPRVEYTLDSRDCRVFCLETAAALGNTGLPDYQAELAVRIGAGNPEFCAALLRQGELLLTDPVSAAARVFLRETDSTGAPFPEIPQPQIESAALSSAIVLLFPVLERLRIDFVTKHEAQLRRCLPIRNSNGEEITDPWDLEIGPLAHITGSVGYAFPEEDVKTIRLCRKVRNLLAHNKPLPPADAGSLLRMG